MQKIEPQILFKHEHCLVVQKPAGMMVVKGRGSKIMTLMDWLIKVKGTKIRAVHRLDRVTEGVCIFATSLFGQQALTEAFRRRLVEKRYLALVEGVPDFEKINIDARLLRVDTPEAKKGPLAHQTIDEKGQSALTRIKVIYKGEGFSLLEAKPHTGRMHQIRVHLSHIGFPIVGDKNYGAKEQYIKNGIMLCAYALTFPLPKGKRESVTAEPTGDFQHFTKKFLGTSGLRALKAYK